MMAKQKSLCIIVVGSNIFPVFFFMNSKDFKELLQPFIGASSVKNKNKIWEEVLL